MEIKLFLDLTKMGLLMDLDSRLYLEEATEAIILKHLGIKISSSLKYFKEAIFWILC